MPSHVSEEPEGYSAKVAEEAALREAPFDEEASSINHSEVAHLAFDPKGN